MTGDLHKREFDRPQFRLDGRERVIHESLRYHPVVGAGYRPSKERGAYSTFEAWVALNVEPGTVQIIPGRQGNPQLLDIIDVRHLYINTAVEFGWERNVTRNWIYALADCGLITDALCAVLAIPLLPRWQPRRTGSIASKTRTAVLAKTSGLCVYCGTKLTSKAGQPNTFHADHVLPVKRGGRDEIANLVPSCATCNSKKSAKTWAQFTGETDEN